MADKENIDIDFQTATIPILKDFLRDRGFPVSGNKKELIERSKGVISLGKKPLSVLTENDLRDQNSRDITRFKTPLGECIPRPEALYEGWNGDIKNFPSFTSNELYNYLVLNKERTCDGASNKASRQLKAKVFYEDRHVHSVEFHQIDSEVSHCYIRCKVIPSLPTAGKKDYEVWTCLSKVTGHVHSAGCNCSAGEGESCNHVAALLYALEDISHKREEGLDSCTSGHNKWKQPRKRRLTPKKSQDLLFKKHKFNECKEVNIPKPKTRTVNPVNTKSFAEKLQKVNPHSCWLLSTYMNVPPPEPLQVVSIKKCYHDSVNLDSEDVRRELKEEMDQFKLPKEEIINIETLTRGQVKNTKWKQARKNLLTSSNFGLVCKRKESTPPESAIKTVLGYSEFTSKATEWGKKHEAAARRKYALTLSKTHKNIKVSDCGLFVCDTMSYLGASPDGLVQCSCCGTGIIEVKCPYKYREKSPMEAAKDPGFYLEIVGKKLKLKTNNNYFYQIQGQMAISGKNFCDFVVWTLEGHYVQRIIFDPQFWQDMLAKLQSFYLHFIMPELFSERIRRGKVLK